MRSIGIRELRQHASVYLRLVEAGETVEVTDRGRPIALLVPTGEGDALARLETQGRLSRATTDVLDLGKPPRVRPGTPSPTERLTAMRSDER